MNGFRLDGKPFSPRTIPPRILRAIALLQKLPNGELLTTGELTKRLSVSAYDAKNYAAMYAALIPYRIKVRFPNIRVVWGNAKTIKELSKHKEILA